MLRDSQGFETKIIDAVRSVNRALGGATGSTADRRSDYNQYEVQLIDAIRSIGRTLAGKGLSVAGGVAGDGSGFATLQQFQDLSRRVTKLEDESFFRLVDGNVTLKEEYQNLWVPGFLAAGGIGQGGGGGGGSSYLRELLDVYHGSGGVLRADGTPAVAGDSLVYNAALGWLASPVSGGGGSSVVITQSTSSGVQTTTFTVDGVSTAVAVKSVAFGTQASDKIPITIANTTKNVLTAHQSLAGYVPTSRQINGHALSSDITISKGDVGLGNVENTKLSTWTGSQNITTLGTIATGVWNGTAIGVTKGGTGLTSIAKGAVLYASANNVLSALAPNGTSTKKFLAQTGSNAPAWSQPSVADIPDAESWLAGKGYASTSDLSALSGVVSSLSSSLNTLTGTVAGLASDLSALSSRVASIEGWFEVVNVGTSSAPVYALHAKNNYAIYSDSWVASGGVGSGLGEGGASTLAQLLDVSLSTLADGDLLMYTASTTKWSNMRKANYLSGYATESWVNQQGFLKTETDPTVPSWAKAESKPSYSLSEISGTADLRAIEALTGTGILKRTGANAWSLDTTTYLASGTTLDSIADGNTRKLANYLPLTGGTMTGAIIMSGANILSSADSANQVGSVTNRFGYGFFRNLYTTYFGFRDDNDGSIQRGTIGMGDGYANIYMQKADGTPYGQYVFNATYGFFHGGNEAVPCGRSDHRWSYLYSVYGDFSGGLSVGGDVVPATDLGSQLGYSSRRFSNLNVRTIGGVKEINFKDSNNSATTGYLSFANGWMILRSGADLNSSYKQITFHETYGLYPETAGVNLGYNSTNYRWANIYGVNADLSGNLDVAGVVRVNSLNTIDQRSETMSLFNFGARSTKTFNAYGLGLNLRAHDANGTQVNILAVNATKIQAGSDLIPNYTEGLNLGGSSANTRWATIYGVDANLSGDLSMTQSSHIDIGPLRIEYDATNKALHITKKDGNDTNTYGLYADGFVASGGVGQAS